MRRLLCVITVCIMILSFCAGCSDNDRFGLGDNEEASVASSIVLSEADARQIADKSPIRLYFANEDNSKLKLEIRYIPVSETTKSVNHLAEIIVNELIKGPKVAGLKPTIPEGTKLRSAIKIEGDVAIVDFTKEFRDNHPGGKAEERMTIYSVVNSLTELKEINKVKFLQKPNYPVRISYGRNFRSGNNYCPVRSGYRIFKSLLYPCGTVYKNIIKILSQFFAQFIMPRDLRQSCPLSAPPEEDTTFETLVFY